MSSNLLDLQNCACFNVRRTARKITQAYDLALKPAGIQATQFSLLSVLESAGSENRIAMSALASRLGMDRTTLSRNLGPAERVGWICITTGQDRRERLIALTPAGRKKLRQGLPYWKKAQERAAAKLGRDGLTELLTLTRRLDAN